MPIKKIEKMYDRLLKELLTYQPDVQKFDNGNITAGIRLRKGMQKIRNMAKEVRSAVQGVKRIKERRRMEERQEEG